jgi:hydrogenase-1 operon protein HyaF
MNIEIPVRVVHQSGNLEPLLQQIGHALRQLAETGASDSIDLLAMPCSDDDLQQLLQILGQGEVEATLQALGRSEIYETAYAGVWVIRHFNSEQQLVSHGIEITRIPDILQSQQESLLPAWEQLNERISQKASERSSA